MIKKAPSVPKICEKTKGIKLAGEIPVNVSVNILENVIAGLTNDVDEVNQ